MISNEFIIGGPGTRLQKLSSRHGRGSMKQNKSNTGDLTTKGQWTNLILSQLDLKHQHDEKERLTKYSLKLSNPMISNEFIRLQKLSSRQWVLTAASVSINQMTATAGQRKVNWPLTSWPKEQSSGLEHQSSATNPKASKHLSTLKLISISIPSPNDTK